jgi:AraC-like DNA-binding protein
MLPVPLFRTSALRPLLSYVERTGLRPERVFGNAFPALQAADRLLPLSEGGRAFEAAANECGSDLGLRLGGRTRVEAIEFGALVRTAGTVREALDLAVRHGSQFNTGQSFSVALRGDDVWVHHRLAASLARGRVQTRDFALSILLGLLRLGAGARWRPAEIHLDGPPPAHAEQLAALAERSTHFGCSSNAVVFPKRVLALCIPRGFALPAPSGGELPSPDGATSLRQAIEALLPLGSVDAATAAEAAGSSLRSFQRRLFAARISFRDLLQRVRRDTALRMLADPDVKVIEIAGALGYTDAANFTRAFRSWTGLSPQEFRRTSLAA